MNVWDETNRMDSSFEVGDLLDDFDPLPLAVEDSKPASAVEMQSLAFFSKGSEPLPGMLKNVDDDVAYSVQASSSFLAGKLLNQDKDWRQEDVLEPLPIVDNLAPSCPQQQPPLLSILCRRLSDADCCDLVVDTFLGGDSPRPATKAATTSPSSSSVVTNPSRIARDSLWHKRYQELLDFYKVHGHTNVPVKYLPSPRLGHWVKRQRSNYKTKYACCEQQGSKKNALDDYREDLLNRIDFVWDVQTENWNAKYRMLCAFQRQYDHTNVPVLSDDSKSPYPGLGVWVKCQRRQYRLLLQTGNSNLTPQRIRQLNHLGFDWCPSKTKQRSGTNDCSSSFQSHGSTQH